MKTIGVILLYLLLAIMLEMGCSGNCDRFGPEIITDVNLIEGRSNSLGRTLKSYDSVNSLDLNLFIGFKSKKVANYFSLISKTYARKECPVMINISNIDSIHLLNNQRLSNRFVQFDSAGFTSISVDSSMVFTFNDRKGSALIRYLKPVISRDSIQFSVRVFDTENGVSGSKTDTLIILP